MAVESPLPEGTLDVFPVQYFSQYELPDRQRLRADREGTNGIFFANNFPAARPAGRHATTGRPTTAATTGHRAIDITAPRGVPVFATKTGTIPTSWWVYNPELRRLVPQPGCATVTEYPQGDGGNYVAIVDEAGRHHYYGHLNEPSPVHVGDRVGAGDLIGYVGNTGRAARGGVPHLHYQVTTRGRGGPSVFWNPYQELVRLASDIGGRPHRSSSRINITYNDFVTAAERLSTPGVVHPWHVGFPDAGADRSRGSTLPPGIVDPWAGETR